MRKIVLLLIPLLILLVSCNQKPTPSVETETEVKVSETYTDEYYRTIIPLPDSPTRGIAINTFENKEDFEVMEEGLMSITTKYLPTNKYIYNPGQVFSEEEVYRMLAPTESEAVQIQKQEEDPEYIDIGLNPEVVDGVETTYITTILEQDYGTVTKDNEFVLDTISIAIGVDSTPTVNGKPGSEITQEEVIKIGKEAANKILYFIRSQEEYANVNVIFGIYGVEEESSLVPGHYLAYTMVSGQKIEATNWEETLEEVILLPSEEASNLYTADNNAFLQFENQIASYFKNFTGVYGYGYYQSGKMYKLEIFIPVEFYSQAEIVTFTQFVASEIEKLFPNDISIEVQIFSTKGSESLIVKSPKNKPQIYIY